MSLSNTENNSLLAEEFALLLQLKMGSLMLNLILEAYGGLWRLVEAQGGSQKSASQLAGIELLAGACGGLWRLVEAQGGFSD